MLKYVWKNKLLIFTIVAILSIFWYGLYVSNTMGGEEQRPYLYVSFSELLNIVILGGVLYWYTEGKNDERRTKDMVTSLVKTVSNDVNNEQLYDIDNGDDVTFIRIKQRSIKNRLDIISGYANRFDYEKEINYSKCKFDEYWNSISENIDNMERLKDMKHVLYDKLMLVSDGTERILVRLYN